MDERGLVKREGTRRAVCLNSDVFWDYSKRIVENMAKALGQHPQLIAWQIDNGLGGNFTEAAFNEDTRRDWHLWLEAKYETIERLNELMGLRHWGQVVTSWNQVPMPMAAPDGSQPGAGAGLVPLLQRHHCAVRQDAGRPAAPTDPEMPRHDQLAPAAPPL